MHAFTSKLNQFFLFQIDFMCSLKHEQQCLSPNFGEENIATVNTVYTFVEAGNVSGFKQSFSDFSRRSIRIYFI